MRPIPLGTKGTFTLRVMPAHLANQFKDAMLPPVLATPMMITTMENAALNAIRGYLARGDRRSRGYPRRRPPRLFNVKARDEKEEIGRGTHERMVVDLRRLDE